MKRRDSRRGGERGLTLVELMLSASVLLIGILAAYGTELSSLNLFKTSRETSTAAADLEAVMEQVLLLPHDSIPLTYPSGAAIAAYNNLHLSNETIVPTYPAGTTADPLEIRLTISWNDYAGRPRTMRISTMKAK